MSKYIALVSVVIVLIVFGGAYLTFSSGGHKTNQSPVNTTAANKTIETYLTTGTYRLMAIDSDDQVNVETDQVTAATPTGRYVTVETVTHPIYPRQFGLEFFGNDSREVLFREFNWQNDWLDRTIVRNYCKVKLVATLSFYFADRVTYDKISHKVKRNIVDALCEITRILVINDLDQEQRERFLDARRILLKILQELSPFQDTHHVHKVLASWCKAAFYWKKTKHTKKHGLPQVFQENRLGIGTEYFRLPHNSDLLELWQVIHRLQNRKNLSDENLASLKATRDFFVDRLAEQCYDSMYN